jgi:hypothetical protein
MTSIAFLQRVMPANIDVTWDVSHAVWKDVKGSIKGTGDWAFMLMLMASWQMKHGPYQQDQRLHQIRQCLAEYAKMVTPDTCEWFRECMPLIAKDRHEEHKLLDDRYPKQLWDDVVLGSHWTRKGTRPTLNRFMSLIREGVQELPLWHTRRHNQIVVCLQEGLLSHRKIQKYIADKRAIRMTAAGQGSVAEGSEDKAPMIGSTVEEKAIKAAAQNLLVVSTLILDDCYNARLGKMIVGVYSGWDTWHQEQNKRLRDVAQTISWMTEQCSGKFDSAISDMFLNASKPSVHDDINGATWPSFH